MPKETTKKSTKGKKTTTNKNVVKKNVPKENNSTKKVAPKEKKVEVKNDVKINVEPISKKVEVKNEKKGSNEKINNFLENTQLVICTCIIVILIALLILVLCMKRIPKVNNKDVVATLNGKTFTANDLYQSMKDDNGTTALINMIDEYIADKEVKLTSDNKKYIDEIVDYYKNYADYYKTDLISFLQNYVGLTGITNEDQFYDFVTKDYKKTLAVTKYIGDEASEEELKAYYKENFSDKLTVKHILIEVDSEAEDADAADKEAYEKAVSLIDTLNDTKKDGLEEKFDELALDNSDDSQTYSNGGLLEDISKSDVVEEFWNAAFDLKNGAYTKEPVKTTYGYHVILRVSSTKVEKYKDIKDEVKQKYAESLLSSDSSLTTTKWDELRKKYKFSIKDDEIKKNYKSMINGSDDKDSKEDQDTKEATDETSDETSSEE
ncbi:MAG: peptidylprolyl isomerase [bacterium]|nr:peptidylprolyl isomerase [bacterium]